MSLVIGLIMDLVLSTCPAPFRHSLSGTVVVAYPGVSKLQPAGYVWPGTCEDGNVLSISVSKARQACIWK